MFSGLRVPAGRPRRRSRAPVHTSIHSLRLHRYALLLAILAWTAGSPEPGWSQESGGLPAEISGGLEVTTLAGSGTVLAGGEVGVRITPSITLGGAGYALLRRVRIQEGAGGPTALGFGYGGAYGEYRHPMPGEEPGGRTVSARLLVGAANTDLVRMGSGADLGTENVLVVHPSVGAELPVRGWLEAGVRAGYRWSTELDRLPGVGTGAVRGVTATIALRFIHGP